MSHQANLWLALSVSRHQDSKPETEEFEEALKPSEVIVFLFDLAKFAIVSVAPKTIPPIAFAK